MIAHTQTLFGSIALVTVITGCCLLLAGQFSRHDGRMTTGLGMLSHAVAYICYTLFGYAPLWISYALGNTLLSIALAFYTVTIPMIRGESPPWRYLFILPLIMCLTLTLLIDTQAPRQLAACLVLFTQCLIIIYYSWKYALPEGKAHRVLLIGAAISLIGLGIRVVVILGGAPTEMHYNANNARQTVSTAIGIVTMIMLSFGLVLMSRERIEADLKKTALHDTLTGISNRLSILKQLDIEIERSRRTETPLSIAMIDIDHFKQINDTYGHPVGDSVLCHCVDHLRHRLRRTDSIGRYGGEEFLLILPGTDAWGALDLVDELRQSLSQNPAPINGKLIPISFSAGISTIASHKQEDLTNLLTRADTALYKAKSAGRNTQVLAESI